jgi:MoaA/NifB/PqqE/SkfB family radical SAM enzyme
MTGYDSICCFRSKPGGRPRLLWELTLSCNLHCCFCHRGNRSGGIWTLDSAIEYLPSLTRSGIKELIISGGEPLILPWTIPFIKHAKQEGFEVDLCTNGTLVTPTLANTLAELLADISVSLDSASAVMHDSLRGARGAWELTVEGIKLLVKAGIDVHVTAVINEPDTTEMIELVKLAQRLHISSLAFIGRMGGAVPSRLSGTWTQDMLKETVALCRSIAKDMPVNTKRLIRPPTFPCCEAGKTVFALDAQGEFLPCILFSGASSTGDYQACECCRSREECMKGCIGSHSMSVGCPGPDTLCGRSICAPE